MPAPGRKGITLRELHANAIIALGQVIGKGAPAVAVEAFKLYVAALCNWEVCQDDPEYHKSCKIFKSLRVLDRRGNALTLPAGIIVGCPFDTTEYSDQEIVLWGGKKELLKHRAKERGHKVPLEHFQENVVVRKAVKHHSRLSRVLLPREWEGKQVRCELLNSSSADGQRLPSSPIFQEIAEALKQAYGAKEKDSQEGKE